MISRESMKRVKTSNNLQYIPSYAAGSRMKFCRIVQSHRLRFKLSFGPTLFTTISHIYGKDTNLYTSPKFLQLQNIIMQKDQAW